MCVVGNHDGKSRKKCKERKWVCVCGGRLTKHLMCTMKFSIYKNKKTNKMASVWSRIRVEPEVAYVYNPSIWKAEAEGIAVI